jgi:hypothetical protein
VEKTNNDELVILFSRQKRPGRGRGMMLTVLKTMPNDGCSHDDEAGADDEAGDDE